MQIPAAAEHVFDRAAKFGIEMSRKAVARVISQNAHQHDGIVLHMIRSAVWCREVFADPLRSFSGRRRTGLGSLDDAW